MQSVSMCHGCLVSHCSLYLCVMTVWCHIEVYAMTVWCYPAVCLYGSLVSHCSLSLCIMTIWCHTAVCVYDCLSSHCSLSFTHYLCLCLFFAVTLFTGCLRTNRLHMLGFCTTGIFLTGCYRLKRYSFSPT